MSDIFISYASADRSRVKPLVDALGNQGWSVWWDRSIPPGKTWDQVIEKALNEARCVIVLWSRDSVQSRWVRTEADEADRRGILVPTLIDDVAIPLAFRRIQAANLIGWSGAPSADFDELAQAVATVLSSNASVAPEAPASAQAASASTAATPEEPRVARQALEKAGGDRASGGAKAGRRTPQRIEEQPPPGGRAELSADHGRTSSKRASGGPNRSLLLIRDGYALVCIAGFVWYFTATRHHSTQFQEIPMVHLRPNFLFRGKTRTNVKDGLAYVWIPLGKFMMGCSPGDSECKDNEKPTHEVTITKGFWMGQTLVTQAAYQRVIIGSNPSRFKGANLPVEQVTWEEARAYCAAIGGRLPTEAEWEYAARAGTTGSRYGDLDRIAWYAGNSGGQTHDVAQKQPNAYGLYDMLGSFWQWAADWYGSYTSGAQSDPSGPSNGLERVIRSGLWFFYPDDVRVSERLGSKPSEGNGGFRCVWE